MKKNMYVIRPYAESPSALAYNGHFYLGYICESSRGGTIIWKKLAWAKKKLAKIQKRIPSAVIEAI